MNNDIDALKQRIEFLERCVVLLGQYTHLIKDNRWEDGPEADESPVEYNLRLFSELKNLELRVRRRRH